MTQETFLYCFAAAWFLAGIAFWIGSMRLEGMPTRWRAKHYREYGWLDWLTVNLLVCLIGGPLLWLAKVIYNLPRRKGS